jgi:acyl carrier protein phosphodiesterase
MLGGIVADFARNPEIALLPTDVQAGVQLHRLIDGFTDSHPIVHRSIGRISAKMGWFSGIVIDVYYDHVLARTFDRYSATPLRAFADSAYALIEGVLHHAPPDAHEFIRRFIDRDYLWSYQTVEGLTRTLTRVSEQIKERIPKRAVWLPDALPDLQAADVELCEDFHEFYPLLMGFAEDVRSRNNLPSGTTRYVG